VEPRCDNWVPLRILPDNLTFAEQFCLRYTGDMLLHIVYFHTDGPIMFRQEMMLEDDDRIAGFQAEMNELQNNYNDLMRNAERLNEEIGRRGDVIDQLTADVDVVARERDSLRSATKMSSGVKTRSGKKASSSAIEPVDTTMILEEDLYI